MSKEKEITKDGLLNLLDRIDEFTKNVAVVYPYLSPKWSKKDNEMYDKIKSIIEQYFAAKESNNNGN